MPINEVLINIMVALNYIVDVEPRFKEDFIENCAEDDSVDAIAEALNDDEIKHVWKSAYIGLKTLEGEIEMTLIDSEQSIGDAINEAIANGISVDDELV